MSFSNLFGTLDLDIGKSFYVYLRQTSKKSTWVLIDSEANVGEKLEDSAIYAALQVNSVNNKQQGYGDIVYIQRLLDLYMQAISTAEKSNVYNKNDTTIDQLFTLQKDNVIVLQAKYKNSQIQSITMNYEGFILVLQDRTLKFPKLPVLSDIVDNKSAVAIIANLGVKTAAEAKIRFNIDEWYSKKEYHSISTNQEFLDMIEKYCQCIVMNEKEGKKVLTGVDTETTGLFTVNLSKDNPAKDYIVAIPFSWEDDKAYLIYTRMVYFPNVDTDLVEKYFSLLFSRNDDFTGQDIVVEVNGNTYSFNRDTICTTGHNTMFDGQTFYSEGINFFFDEDSLQLVFNLATDWSKGKSSLKALTRRIFGDETLELEDLFGSKHKDKFGYLQDEELARIYGCADADYSRLVLKKLKSMTNPNLYYQYKKYDMCLMHLYAKASANGMPIDTESVKHLGSLVKQDIETLKDFVYQYAYKSINKKTNLKVMDIISSHYNQYFQDFNNYAEKVDTANIFDQNERYYFKFTPAELKVLLFNILGYPIVKMSEKNGQPALDKFVLKQLQSQKLAEPIDALRDDLPSHIPSNEPLLKAKEFNTDKYPLARVLAKYAELNKEYTAYYAPIVNNNLEDRMFKGFSTTKAATRRIINPLQTAKSTLKKYFIAPKGKIFCSFDVSQMEYRLMASVAYISLKRSLMEIYPDSWEFLLKKSSISIIKHRMTNPENDFHIETASTLYGIPPYLVTKKLRKTTKTMGFGIPYGLGLKSLCESLFTDATKENLAKTKELLDLFKEKQSEIIKTLDYARDNAFVPVDISDDFREFLDIGNANVGFVKNFAGFYRMFILQDLTKKNCASIRRKAGNFGIQGGAAELFRRMLYRFHMNCVKAGINHKIQWLLTVHDELDFLVDDDIDILQLIEIMYKSCTLVYEDHIPYYIGINFGKNWYDAKADEAELPVIMVQRLVREYHNNNLKIPCDGNQVKVLLELKHKYLADRIYEELIKAYPNFKDNYLIDLTTFDNVFINYTVRSYIFEFIPSEYKRDDSPLVYYLTFWAKERIPRDFDKVVFKLEENKYVTAKETLNSIMSGNTSDIDLESIILSDDFFIESIDDDNEKIEVFFGEEAFDDTSVDDTEQSLSNVLYLDLFDNTEEDDEYSIDFSAKDTHSILKLTRYARKYVNTLKENEFSIITSSTRFSTNPTDLIKYIQQLPKGEGTIYVVWNKLLHFKNISCDTEVIDNLDKFIGGVK